MLIEAAAEIIRTEGYAALSARRLAEKVGLKRQIVHYYFSTVEDLLLAVVRHYGDAGLKRFAEAARGQNPLRVIWEMETDASATTFAFMAMASHRPAIRSELRRYMDEFRKIQADAVARYFAEHKIDAKLSPVAAATIIQSISQALMAQAALGVSRGHAETKATVEAWLENFGAHGQKRVSATRRPRLRKSSRL